MAISQTADFFDGYAADFEALYGNRNNLVNGVVNRLLRRSMQQRFELTIACCSPIQGRSALDIGCGPGHYAIELGRRGAALVVGLDFANGMLEIAQAKTQRAGLEEICQFECTDFMSWSAPTKFDYVVAMGFMDYVAEAREIVVRALSLAKVAAYFSFPRDGGFLAWQRRVRYYRRCPSTCTARTKS
jgi:2-polyprenyl-3-methyl-5-hydroxy-6-metoxy-1,4-benzoquinol methylase